MGNIAALLFGFVCGVISTILITIRQHQKNEELKIKIKGEIKMLSTRIEVTCPSCMNTECQNQLQYDISDKNIERAIESLNALDIITSLGDAERMRQLLIEFKKGK